jgi:hypothetical protein
MAKEIRWSIRPLRDTLVYYRLSDDFVEVITISDPRRNPKKLKL